MLLSCFPASTQERKRRLVGSEMGEASSLPLSRGLRLAHSVSKAQVHKGSPPRERTGNQCPSDCKAKRVPNFPLLMVFLQHQMLQRAPGTERPFPSGPPLSPHSCKVGKLPPGEPAVTSSLCICPRASGLLVAVDPSGYNLHLGALKLQRP